MKTPVIAIMFCLAAAGCRQIPEPVEKITVTTPTGRKEKVTRQYTIKEVEEGSIAAEGAKNPFDIHHPVYPGKKQLDELKRQFKAGDQVWYFQGLDSGWVLVRNRQVAWMLVTSHEY